ncbi:hypothetical protein M0802_015334 [Mischocyttarus mexicanus]|nr:hypothetical protein M0802_015334 [Mischocyttarus mexicanus]
MISFLGLFKLLYPEPLQKGVRILLQPTPAGRKRRPMGLLNITMNSDFRYHSWSEGIHYAAVQDGVLTGHSSSTTLDFHSTTEGNLAVGMLKATGAKSQVGDLACGSVYTTGKGGGSGSGVSSRKRLPRIARLEQVDSDGPVVDISDYSDSEERGLRSMEGLRPGDQGTSVDYCRLIDKIRKCLDTVESDRKKS